MTLQTLTNSNRGSEETLLWKLKDSEVCWTLMGAWAESEVIMSAKLLLDGTEHRAVKEGLHTCYGHELPVS